MINTANKLRLSHTFSQKVLVNDPLNLFWWRKVVQAVSFWSRAAKSAEVIQWIKQCVDSTSARFNTDLSCTIKEADRIRFFPQRMYNRLKYLVWFEIVHAHTSSSLTMIPVGNLSEHGIYSFSFYYYFPFFLIVFWFLNCLPNLWIFSSILIFIIC